MKIVDPSQIESELIQIWEALAKENKTRACLFNLIVFSSLSSRTDYFRNIVQTVVEKFPCRVLFISSDPESSHPYLKTAVSVIFSGSIACDNIDIGVSGTDLERVPFLLLPHLVPDLPTYLLWGEDPSKKNSLFAPLSNLATRLIFDSEAADNLSHFAKTLLNLKNKDIADLNWARTEGWRDLAVSLFETASLAQAKKVRITYNCRKTLFFCHNKIQALYFSNWLCNRLHWKVKPEIIAVEWENLGPGNLIALDYETDDNHIVQCKRLFDELHQVRVEKSDLKKCDLPYQFVLGKSATGQSLAKEITRQGTSSHYLEVLRANNLG